MRAFCTLLFTVAPLAAVQVAQAACPPELNSAAITFIKGAEGFVEKPYLGQVGPKVVGTWSRPTAAKRLNAGEDPNTVAAEEFPKFKLAGGKVLDDLVKRRAAEVKSFKTPSSNPALPC